MVQIQKYRDFYGLHSINIAIFVDYIPKTFKTRVKILGHDTSYDSSIGK